MKTLDFTARFSFTRLEFMRVWREIVGKRPADVHASWSEMPDGSELSFMAFTQRTKLTPWELMQKFAERDLLVTIHAYDHTTGRFLE